MTIQNNNKVQLSIEDMAYGRLLCYMPMQWPNYIIGDHHRIIADHLEALERREITRLLITAPPRHGKTMELVEGFGSWYFGRNPSHQVIYSTYSSEKAEDHGLVVKNLMLGENYTIVFPESVLRQDSKSRSKLATTAGGHFFFTGVGGAIVGRGADLFIFDDLIKTREEAESPANIRRIENFYKGIAYSRLMPQGVIVYITCVAEGERILMGDGTWEKIENVSVGDYVIGYNNKHPVKKRVLDTKCSGEDDILEVVSRSCSLKVNKRHPFLVVKGGLKYQPRNQEDVIVSRKWDLEWVTAGELKPNDIVVTIKSMQAGHGTKPFGIHHKKQQTSDDYWLLGFLFGDGWLINSGKRGVVGFCVADSDKPDLNYKVKTLLKKQFGANLKQTNFGYSRCDSKSIGHWLSSQGLISGAHKKRLPKWLFRTRRRFKKQFLKGFFAADGYEKPKGSFHVHICNKNLLDDMRLLARTCGIKTTKIYTYSQKVKPPNSPKEIVATGYTARFYDKSNKIELRSRYRKQGDIGRYFRFEKIESVTAKGKAKVYDITVDGAESFVAEGFVVHNTRWSKDDLAGTLLKEREDWIHLDFKAICEDTKKDPLHRPVGTALWPERYSLEALQDIKSNVGTREWNAQYQQNPVDSEGGIIHYDWIKYYDKKPNSFDKIVQSWDTAFSKNTTNAPSVCLTFGQKDHYHYLLDVYRGFIDYPTLKRKARELYEDWDASIVLVEDRASGQSLVQELKQDTGIPIKGVYPKGSKEQRLASKSGLVETGRVLFPETAPWLTDTITEIIAFPSGKYKDVADALSQYLNYAKGHTGVGKRVSRFWK